MQPNTPVEITCLRSKICGHDVTYLHSLLQTKEF